MKKFSITVLGSSAAMPAFGRFTSCQAVNYNDNIFLIDAGEGAQIRLTQYKIKRQSIRCIFISHLHGDHIFGLPGILTSFNHLDRKTPLQVFGPKGIKDFVKMVFAVGQTSPKYPLEITEIDHEGEQEIWKNHELSVKAFPLNHRIATYGYRFDEKLPSYNIHREAIAKYGLSHDEIKQVKLGVNIEREGKEVDFRLMVFPQPEPRKYAYCSDTVYDETLVQYIQDVNLVYHETTYTSEFEKEARERMHTTAAQAATIGKLANAKALLTGHYSARYKDVDELVTEARTVFNPVIKGYDGAMIDVT